MTKILAFYLPQYHCIPENDKWWGDGFTEWTNTSKAKPLFKGHNQPREPYDGNYYNLLNEGTRRWQADLAKKYNIYGFCYYHYWFNGKMLLEKPLEQVIELGEPDLPFCVCWANESWTRAWDGGEKQVLIAQEYGNKNDWKEHFNYLLKLFKDKRYILIDNKPLLVIYRTSNICCCDEMIEYWNGLALQNGFNGIYFTEMLTSYQKKSYSIHSEALIEMEPMYTLNFELPITYRIRRKIKRGFSKLLNTNTLNTFDYDFVWNNIINRKRTKSDKKIFPGAFVDWDNSPRKGKNGVVFKGASPEKFEKYLAKQIQRVNKVCNSDFIFINAWNEWAEGTYLEPDTKNGYSYLEAVREALKQTK